MFKTVIKWLTHWIVLQSKLITQQSHAGSLGDDWQLLEQKSNLLAISRQVTYFSTHLYFLQNPAIYYVFVILNVEW